MKTFEMRLEYKSLIALLQGKKLHIQDGEISVTFHPPFDGIFLTHKEIYELEATAERRVLNMVESISNHYQKKMD
jgi:hypothetical protein